MGRNYLNNHINIHSEDWGSYIYIIKGYVIDYINT
jgi:hypothetical protein